MRVLVFTVEHKTLGLKSVIRRNHYEKNLLFMTDDIRYRFYVSVRGKDYTKSIF